MAFSEDVIPKAGAVQPAEGSRVKLRRFQYVRDPSLRLKSGSAQDDTVKPQNTNCTTT